MNGVAQSIATTPGTYATLTRSWTSGDTVTVRLPMAVRVEPSNDNPNVAAIFYGPVVLAGNYGSTTLSGPPALTSSVTRTSSSSLAFTATANGATVNLGPFYDAHGFNYTVYWIGQTAATGPPRSGCSTSRAAWCSASTNASTADGALALQWDDNGTTDHDWVPVVSGTSVKLRCVNSGKVLGVGNMSTADGARVLQWGDTGTADHLWTILDNGDGTHRVRNNHTGKLLGTASGSTARGAQVVMDPDNGSADNRWRFVPTGARRIQNVNSGRVLGVTDMSTADGALVIQWGDTGTADHLWTAVVGTNGYFRLRNQHTGKVLAVESGGTANGTRAVQMTDTGAPASSGGSGTRPVTRSASRRRRRARPRRPEHVDRSGRAGARLGRQRHERPSLALRVRRGRTRPAPLRERSAGWGSRCHARVGDRRSSERRDRAQRRGEPLDPAGRGHERQRAADGEDGQVGRGAPHERQVDDQQRPDQDGDGAGAAAAGRGKRRQRDEHERQPRLRPARTRGRARTPSARPPRT